MSDHRGKKDFQIFITEHSISRELGFKIHAKIHFSLTVSPLSVSLSLSIYLFIFLVSLSILCSLALNLWVREILLFLPP